MCRISSHWRARRPETADQLCNVFPLPPPPYPPTPPPVCNPPSGTSHQCYACAKSEFVGVPGELRWQTTCVTCPSTPPLPSLASPRKPHQTPVTSAMQLQSQHMMACQESCSGRPAVHLIICIWPLLPSSPCQVAERRRRGWSGGVRTPLWGPPHLSKQPLQVCHPLPAPSPPPLTPPSPTLPQPFQMLSCYNSPLVLQVKPNQYMQKQSY